MEFLGWFWISIWCADMSVVVVISVNIVVTVTATIGVVAGLC